MLKRSLWRPVALAVVAAAVVGCTAEPIYLPEANEARVAEIRGGAAADGDAAADAAPAGEGWGTLKGQFVINGAAPQLPGLPTGGKDSPTCAASIPDDSLVVDSASGGIANVVIFLRKASRVHPDGIEPPEDPLLFDQKECRFLTHVMPVQVGRLIEIKNSDPISHNTNISPPGDTAINPLLSAGTVGNYTFGRRQNSPVAVSCNVHPWMKAYIIPREDPYLAVTATDGTFEIANLPAGEPLEFEVWHERTGGLEAKSDWKKGRFKITRTGRRRGRHGRHRGRSQHVPMMRTLRPVT